MIDLMSRDQMNEWIQKQSWYQTIDLHDGLYTPGKVNTRLRLAELTKVDFTNKRVLDIGCNSGQYCLFAKKMGASEVVGVDIDERRLAQARTLASYEGYNIIYETMSASEIQSLGSFDIVFCFAVLTEISDLFGTVRSLREAIGDYALLELDLARPMLFLPQIRHWFRRTRPLELTKAFAEIRVTKRGDFVISPTLEVLAKAFGEEFYLKALGKGLRYDLIEVKRSKPV
ncbi:MAG: methyltransferase domain-containing protein [bacterium]